MRDELIRRWQGVPAVGRVLLAVGLSVLLLGTAAAAWWALREEQQVLFSGLSPQDAAAVVKELDRQKIAYRLADDGGTILVAQEAVHKTRLRLMGSGGPALQGTVGFEMFNNADFGMTDFAQRINYQRAMQGELQRTISSLAEVSSARVHLVLPEGGLFRKGQAKPKAAVTLGLKAALKPAQILSIQRLVAAAVPEMEPGAVTVVDQQGDTLSRTGTGGDEAEGGSGRIEAKQQAEAYVRRKVVEVLDRALGVGRAIVTVDAVLNADRVQYTREELVPYSTVNGQAVGATVKRRESVQSSGGMPVGEAQPKAGKAADGGTAAESSGHTVEVEYANGRKVEQVVLGSGNIRQISVGVLVPADVPPAELPKLRSMVAMAVGLNEARGDALALHLIEARPVEAAAETLLRDSVPEATEARPATPRQPPAAAASVVPWRTSPAVAWLAVAALLAVVAVVLLLRRHRHGASPGRLTEAQRAALFEDVRRWAMEGAERKPASGA